MALEFHKARVWNEKEKAFIFYTNLQSEMYESLVINFALGKTGFLRSRTNSISSMLRLV